MCDLYKDINLDHNFINDENINSISIVTAFFDIEREKWATFNRTVDCYINSFLNLLLINKKMVIFIDDKYTNNISIKKTIEQLHIAGDNSKIFIPINIDWLNENCASWKKNHISEDIMKSENYINRVKHRIISGNPENIYSKYNTINHSKIDFIKYAIDNNLISNSEFVCWCDFGYYNSILNNNPNKFPDSELDLNKFNTKKLNFFLYDKIRENDYDMDYTLINAPPIFTGSLFAGPKEMMMKLHSLYHECLDELYNNNISDDDQHVYLRCYLKDPSLFELFLSQHIWPQVLLNFQKKN